MFVDPGLAFEYMYLWILFKLLDFEFPCFKLYFLNRKNKEGKLTS